MQLYDLILIQVYLELNNTNDKAENKGGGIAVCYLLKTKTDKESLIIVLLKVVFCAFNMHLKNKVGHSINTIQFTSANP